MIRENVYTNQGNEIILGLVIDGVEWSAETITRVVLTLTNDDGGVVTIDSAIAAAAFDWTTTAAVLDDIVTVLTLTLGGQSIPIRDDYICALTIYSTTLGGVVGIVWDDTLALNVK